MDISKSTYWHLQVRASTTLLVLLALLAPDHAFADKAPEVLVIRADRLPAKTKSVHSVIPARDPFAWPMEQLRRFGDGSGGLKKDPFADFTLNAIIWTENDPVAIINKIPLRRGESIDGARIQDIDKNSVIIENRRTSRKLSFPDPLIELNRPAEAD